LKEEEVHPRFSDQSNKKQKPNGKNKKVNKQNGQDGLSKNKCPSLAMVDDSDASELFNNHRTDE